MRKSDEDWVKKCMEFRVEGRRPVGSPIRTWLECVELYMAELEIDKAYVIIIITYFSMALISSSIRTCSVHMSWINNCMCARRSRLCVWIGLTNILFIDESMAVQIVFY